MENGNLVLQAVYDPAASAIRGQPFTSARVRTAGKFAVVPTATSTIRIEARIKVPQGLGLWPAFWLLPEEGSSASCSGCGRHGTWAASGEIDVMEVANNAMQVCAHEMCCCFCCCCRCCSASVRMCLALLRPAEGAFLARPTHHTRRCLALP